MRNINAQLSDEVYKILIDYKFDNKLKSINECLNKILIELKGGKKNE